MNDDWHENRKLVNSTLERHETEIDKLKSKSHERDIRLNDQKWYNRILIISGGAGGGAVFELLKSLLLSLLK